MRWPGSPAADIAARSMGALATLFAAAAGAEEIVPSPPAIDPWRYSEDYRYLQDPAFRSGAWWEKGKWMPFGASGGLTVGAELRARYEHYTSNEFGHSSVKRDGSALYRALPYADLKLNEHARIFTQLNLTHARRNDSTVGPVDDTGAEVLQGFVDVSLPSRDAGATLRVGRQVLAYGSERLVSVRYGPNVLRAFDGGLLAWRTSHSRTEAFLLRPVRNAMGSFNDRGDPQRRLWGVYTTFQDPGNHRDTGVDVYYLGLSNDHARYDQGEGAETRNTLGSRWFGRRNGWNWDLEGFFQYGSFAGVPVRAWSLASDVRHRFDAWPLTPQLGLKANIISGDRDPDDRALQTFNVMFPKGKYFGESGQVGPTNLINLHPSLELDLGGGWSLASAVVFYWRQSVRDGVYGVAGNLLRPAGNSRARYIGTQADLVLGREISRQLSVEAAYSIFKPGRFIRDTGRADTVHFIGLEALWRY
ncbi:alginate export family protein [Stenotrophomonas sp. ATs4]|uniref:alginate export family protein n=1 Tax=Stenotrophomonas sp. ATs4 TaxID=3402766 RepID=UPI003F70F0EA